MDTYIHIRKFDSAGKPVGWDNYSDAVKFERLPNHNEYFSLAHDQYFKVILVVTNNFTGAKYPYEIFAEPTALERN